MLKQLLSGWRDGYEGRLSGRVVVGLERPLGEWFSPARLREAHVCIDHGKNPFLFCCPKNYCLKKQVFQFLPFDTFVGIDFMSKNVLFNFEEESLSKYTLVLYCYLGFHAIIPTFQYARVRGLYSPNSVVIQRIWAMWCDLSGANVFLRFKH